MESSQTSRDGDQTWQKVVAISMSVLIIVTIIIAARYLRMRTIVSSSALLGSQLRRKEQQRQQKQEKGSLLVLLPIAKYSTRMQQDEHMEAEVTTYIPQGQSKTKRGKPGFEILWKNRKCNTDSIAILNKPNGLGHIPDENASLQDTQSNDPAACSICTERFVADETIRILPCGHIYHRQCVDSWLLDFGNTCPLWRTLQELLLFRRSLPKPPGRARLSHRGKQ